jgi:AraC-like DNA-binding protein
MISNTAFSDPIMSQTAQTTAVKGESQAYRHFIDSLSKSVPFSEAVLATSLPRGGLQLVQPQKMPDAFLKGYSKEWQVEDDAAWGAIVAGKAVRGNAESKYVLSFLSSFGYQHVAAVPVEDPVLNGYIGVLELHRTAEQGAFTSKELEKLNEAAEELSEALRQVRSSRSTANPLGGVDWVKRPKQLQFVVDRHGSVILFKSSFESLDHRLRDQILHETRKSIQHLPEEGSQSSRLLLPDEAGDHWTLNAVAFRSFPALSGGPVVFFCLQPACPEWSLLRPGDFAGDAEMSRLVPAIRFMEQEFHRGPTLTEIAKTVHLSPFHFHRRFTELFGLTPKHFLLECQIHDAKGHLMTGEKELTKIAADCGFAHQSHFTSRFKQATGLTPTRWRRMAHDRQSSN